MDYYTDGSRIKAPEATDDEYKAGIGVIIGWGSHTEGKLITSHAHFGGSNINAEMFAVRDTLEALNEDLFLPEDNKIQIVTDSITSIQIVNIVNKMSEEEYKEGHKTSELKMNEQSALRIKKAQKELEEKGYEVTYKHIRGHGKDPLMSEKDIEGNRLADQIATSAAAYMYNESTREKTARMLIDWYSENRKALHYIK